MRRSGLRDGQVAVGLVAVMGNVALHAIGAQQRIDAAIFIEGLVDEEAPGRARISDRVRALCGHQGWSGGGG